jgi:penicillin-binding protein 1A
VVERVRSASGKILFERVSQSLGRIVEPQYVAMMNMMMRETLLSGTAQRAQLAGWTAAGKTGTSQDFRDAWFVGYTSRLITGVWLGNDDASPTKKLTGSSLPIDIWNPVMRSAHHGIPVAGLPGLPDLSFASAIPPTDIRIPFGHEHASPPQPSQRNLDAWFFERLDRLLGRR